MDRLSRHRPDAGYIASDSAAREGSVITGSRNSLWTGLGQHTAYEGMELKVGVAGGLTMANIPDGGYASLGLGASTLTSARGSIIGLVARAIGFIGGDALYINGVSRAVNASTALQILLYRAGLYTGAGTGPYIAGIEQATAPTIAAHSTNTSTTNIGTTSAVIWFVRGATGGRGRRSLPSNVLSVNGKTVRLTVASGDLTTATTFGYDRIGIGVTLWGFGSSGPHYEEREIAISSLTTVDGVANSVELEWASAKLAGADLAPIDDYPPPAAVFAVAIEDVVAVIGAYGDSTSGVTTASPGTAIAVSLPVFIESFPPDNLLFLPEAPIGVLPRASGGFAYIGCKNSMHALVYTGGSPALSLQTIWASTGIVSQHGFCLGEGGRLYAFTGGRGLVRIGEQGEPETEWAAPVAEEVATWVPTDFVIAGWDDNSGHVVFAQYRQLLAYNTKTGQWSTPLNVASQLATNEIFCGCVTVQGSLYLAVRDTVNIGNPVRLFSFTGGTGTTYEIFTPWHDSPAHADEIFEVDVELIADNFANTVTARLYVNGDRTAHVAEKTFTLTRVGRQHLPLWRPNVRGAKSHSVYVSQESDGGLCGVESIEVRGVYSSVAV